MNKKIHILEVNKFYYPHIGGIENVIQYHSEYFQQNEKTEVKVLVCQEKGKASEEIINDVSVYRASSIGTYFSCPLSFEFIRKFKKLSKWADIIEIHVPFPLGDLACLLSGYKGKVVISWHSDIIKQKKLLMFYKPILKRFLKRADLIITATENHITSSSFLPPFKDKCAVVPYGINIDEYSEPKTKDFLSDKAFDKNNLKFLFVGRLVYYKGIDVLIESFIKLKDKPYELFIAGVGTLEDEMKQKVAENNLSEKVHFIGRLSDDDLKSAFADCDVFLFPSVANSEAFGIVQLEAMIYGKPVINTSLPTGVPLVSVNNETGITVSPNSSEELTEAVKAIAEDKTLREKYSLNAKKRVEKYFNQKINNQKLYELFKQLLKEGL